MAAKRAAPTGSDPHAEPTTPVVAAAPEPTEQAIDEGFTSESHSAGFVNPPEDTTLATAPIVAADGVVDENADLDGVEEVSRSQMTAETVKPAAGVKPKAPKKGSVEEREATLTRGISQKTYELRKTEGTLAERARALADLEQKIAAKQAELGLKPDGTPAAKPAPAADIKPLERPKHPNYREFDTDEAYEAAVVAWETAMGDYEGQRQERLKQELTGAIDTRLSAADQQAAARASLTKFQERVRATAAKYPDTWKARAEALDAVQSNWFDPTKHGQAKTPFLSDLGRNHEEGPEFLHWLGEDVELAQILADLEPSQAMRDGLLTLPSLQPVMAYFGTAEGLAAFNELAEMHPVRAIQRLGVLHASLAAEPSGPVAKTPSITAAKPPLSHRPGVAAATAPAAKGAEGVRETFEQMNERLDKEELEARRKALGLTG